MKTFLTSDTHFGHLNIIDYCNRPFTAVEDQNAQMTENWNSVVNSDDLIIHLGDFALGKKDLWPSYVNKLNGRKILVMGNHDKVDKTVEASVKRFLDLGFDEVYPEDYYFSHSGKVFWCSHIPTSNEPDKRGYKRPEPKYFNISLCGHIHDRWKSHNLEINVGVDVWDFKPVSVEEVIAYHKALTSGT